MKHEMGSVIGNVNSFLRTESGKPKNIPQKTFTARRETATNIDTVLGYMGVLDVDTTELIKLIYPDARVEKGYVKGEDGSILPAAVVRWDTEQRTYPFGNKMVSSAVRVVCHTQDDFVEIHYSSEGRSGQARVRTSWKKHGMDLPGYHEEGRDPSDNYITVGVLGAMDLANGKMFDDGVESSGVLAGRRITI